MIYHTVMPWQFTRLSQIPTIFYCYKWTLRKIFDGILILLSDSEVCCDQHLILHLFTFDLTPTIERYFIPAQYDRCTTVHKVLNASKATANQHALHVTSQQYGAPIGPQCVFPCVTVKWDAGDTLDHPLDTNFTFHYLSWHYESK